MATSSGDVAKQRESWKHILIKILCFFLCASRGFVLNNILCVNSCLFTFDTWNVNDTSSMHWFGLLTNNPYVTYVHNIHLRERSRFLFLSVNLYTGRVGSEEGENTWVAENHTHTHHYSHKFLCRNCFPTNRQTNIKQYCSARPPWPADRSSLSTMRGGKRVSVDVPKHEREWNN